MPLRSRGLTLASRDFAPRRLAQSAATWLLLAAVALVAGTTFWPWAQVQPLKRPLQAVSLLSGFDWNATVLFRGADVPATALPLDYVPRWALLAMPPVVLAGGLLSLLPLLRRAEAAEATRWRVVGLWVAALFPPLYVILSHATIYDGIRHLLFAYPPLVALAAVGWTTLLSRPAAAVRLTAAAALLAGLFEPAWFVWRNHPNECVYVHALAGGPRAALGRYELDYWGNSVHQAVAWVAQVTAGSGTRIVLSGHPPHVVRDEARRRPGLDFARNELKRHHLDVLVLRGTRREVLELAGRQDAVHRVTTADGTPLAIVVPGPAFAEIAGLPAFAGPRVVLR